MRKSALLFVMLLFIAASFSAFAQDEEDGTFTLQILHSSDNESSFQDPNTLEPKLLNYAAVLGGLDQLVENTIHVTAGDHTLPGPFFEAAGAVESLGTPGLADIAFFNAMNLTANGMGNHEFDAGLDNFATMLSTANYPFLAVNLDFSNATVGEGVPAITIAEDGQNVTDIAGQVAKSAFVEVGGERIGLIGRAPADFFNVIEDPDTNLPGVDFVGGRNAEDNQPLESAVDMVLEQVEILEAQGINKIILLDHAQDFTGDPLSASSLRGIDVVVAAGSTGFMARPEADGPFNLLRDGDSPEAAYPTLRLDSEGNFVAVVNSDQLFTYVGNLIISFDANGNVLRVDPRSGPVATNEAGIAALEEVLGSELTVSEEIQTTYDALVGTELIQSQFEVVGITTSELDGARANVRSMETNLGRLSADSTLWWARQNISEDVDIALKNGGGIRATILGPNITRLTIGAALAFNNEMVAIDLTGDQLLAAMENAVSRVPATDGRFPQIAGMVIEYDATMEGISDQVSLTEASRIQSLVVTRADGTEVVLVEGGEVVGDLTQTFTLVTNSFLLTGGDGYQAFLAASEANGSENPGVGERQILEDYITEVLGGEVDLVPPFDDPRVIRLDGMEEME